ncbi:unnamed protein product [Paramecium sonneborni]|uniref:Uncharacterized protein n=1 Tax=Paramecium sonneborni TaxID=65129 RepID=A0A8S1PZ67_9CILI|nr:unnamed protein product [Paramecium sonneborni]
MNKIIKGNQNKYFEWITQNKYKDLALKLKDQEQQKDEALHFDEQNLLQLKEEILEIPHSSWKFLSETKLKKELMNISASNYIEVYENGKGDQVIYFGRYKNKVKDGLWQTLYCLKSGKELIGIGGGLYKNGIKIGKWVEVYKCLIDKLILYQGNYRNGNKIGQWNFKIFENQNKETQIIGGGIYDNNTGFKNGIWIDLHSSYDMDCKTILIGEYKNGIKQGFWKIKQKIGLQQQKFCQIGGGNYNKKGQKIKKWIDLHEDFDSLCIVTYQGEYINGNKIGIWNVIHNKRIRAYGIYELIGQKFGKWIQLYDNYYDLNQIIEIGNYENGKKCKDWTIMMKIPYYERNIKIGGGIYDEIEGKKVGFWVEPHFNFYEDCQIIMIGDYNMGNRIGNWEIYFRMSEKSNYQTIGQGNYNQNGIKFGKWDELQDSYDCNHQIIYSGEYDNGQKNGLWDIKYRTLQEQFQKIGGGNYDNDQKNGRWIEPIYNFNYQNQIFFDGSYQNNQKLGKWNLLCKKSYEDQYQILGGGNYEEKYGTKDGIWIEINDLKNLNQQTKIAKTNFQNGMKLFPIKKFFVL